MSTLRSLRSLVAICALLAAPPAAAQQPSPLSPPSGLQATRPALAELLGRLEALAQAPESNTAVRAAAQEHAAALRTRLAEGDYRPGDRVLIRVEGGGGGSEPTSGRPAPGGLRSVEQELSDTFPVGSNRDLILPVIGVISLQGVLRSELEAHLTRELQRFIKEPVVRARSLIRVSVVGAVARPGFHAVPADAILSDALMAAGGLTNDAKLKDLRIERSGQPLWQGKELQSALAHGRTLDEMNLRAGDQFFVPLRGRSGTFETARTVSILLGIPVTIYTLTRIFRNK
jgi:protein involved in polysaccharide export with SLBB domain